MIFHTEKYAIQATCNRNSEDRDVTLVLRADVIGENSLIGGVSTNTVFTSYLNPKFETVFL